MTNNYHFCFISYILFHFDCSNPDYFSTKGLSTFGLVPKAQCTKSTTCCGLTCPTSLNWFWLTSHATIHLCCKVLLVQIILTIYKSVFKAAKKCLKKKEKKKIMQVPLLSQKVSRKKSNLTSMTRLCLVQNLFQI